MILKFRGVRFALIVLLCLMLTNMLRNSGDYNVPMVNPDNICEIFATCPQWYKSALTASRKWGIPIPVMMAIMYQESSFRANARPPRSTILFILPGPRPSTAYGYSQALNGTWDRYLTQTGKKHGDRDNFSDAIDFIGWYCYTSFRECGIDKNDVYSMYLAYHEGQRGFMNKTYRKKSWLCDVSRRVRKKRDIYIRQMSECSANRGKWLSMP
ncbi:transglycosylase SLT domain-containing protein [Desulfobacterales bacterium HSG16]|nr:transglycosylase SLT domain-containing protein [Desulfobacterales bacterium HSG16]